jgi:hypothetical protein
MTEIIDMGYFESEPYDNYHNQIEYHSIDAHTYELRSLGPDGRTNTKDDLCLVSTNTHERATFFGCTH